MIFNGDLNMSKTWSKEDRAHYNNSEVMQELEKAVISNAHRLEILQKKIAENKIENVVKDVERAKVAVTGLGNEIGKLNLAEDAPEGDVSEGDVPEEISEEESENTKEAVIKDLRGMVKKAIEGGDVILAYKIERTIDEILEG
jgi:hypothetical protein